MKRGPVDGLIGMWAFTVDKNGDVDRQFEILRRTGDAYIVQMYALKGGAPAGLFAIPRKTILSGQVFENSDGLSDAIRAMKGEKDFQRFMRFMEARQNEPLMIAS